MISDPLSLSIFAVHQGLIKKKFSAFELACLALERASSLNPSTNAYITLNQSATLNQAKNADQLIAAGKSGLLTGIPYSLKDTYTTTDFVTTAGSKILKDYIPPYDATIYQRLKHQGAVLIGKNNQDSWGHGASNENSDYGPVKNPWNLNHVAGGSSGGCAAAIASRTVCFAIGEDTGGSIRNPASYCNVTGLKVTYGRVSRYGTIAYASSLDTVGPMAKTAADCAIVLKAIAGQDLLDSSSSQLPVPDYLQNLSHPPKNLTLGVLDLESISDHLDPQVKEATDQAIDHLRSQGFSTKPVTIPSLEFGIAIYYTLAFCETSSNLARYDGVRFGSSRKLFTNESVQRILTGTFALSSGYYDAYYRRALKARTKLISEYRQAFKSVDVILSPVTPTHAPKLNQSQTNPRANYLADLLTCPTSTAGLCSIAIPAGFTSQNLPVGLQLTAPMFHEETILGLAHLYQNQTSWHCKTLPNQLDLKPRFTKPD